MRAEQGPSPSILSLAGRGEAAEETGLFGTVILWTHAAAGAIWVGACACFVIAGLALVAGSDEQRSFIVNAAPKIDALGLVAAVVLLITGFVNLTTAGISRRFVFSTAFTSVLAIKITLFIVMIVVMTWSMRIGATIRAVLARGRADAVPGAMRRMVRAHIAIVALGGIALMLGTWLMGS
jgi:putative copper export protein